MKYTHTERYTPKEPNSKTTKEFPTANSATLLLPLQKENQNASPQVARHANVTIHAETSIFDFNMEYTQSIFR